MHYRKLISTLRIALTGFGDVKICLCGQEWDIVLILSSIVKNAAVKKQESDERCRSLYFNKEKLVQKRENCPFLKNLNVPLILVSDMTTLVQLLTHQCSG